jgi:DNA-binding Lrp family transcriptional regulator
MATKLDLKDRRILYELNRDSSQSNSRIAKKVRLSKHAVAYRINKLIQSRIIVRFHTAIDIKKLGYFYCRFHIKTRRISDAANKELLDHLTKHPFSHWVAACDGKYNLIAGFMLKDIEGFYAIYRELLNKFQELIKEIDFVIIARLPEFDRAYLIGQKTTTVSEKMVLGEASKARVGAMDKKILAKLALNSRRDKTKIAKELGTTPAVVRNRIKMMEKQNIISGYGVDLDIKKIGYEFYKALLYVTNFTEEKEKTLLEFCKQQPNIYHLIICLGKWGVELNIEAKSNQHYREIINQLKEKFSDVIIDYDTLLITNTLTENYFPRGISE